MKLDIVRLLTIKKLPKDREINLLGGAWTPRDIQNFFFPLDPDKDLFVVVPRDTTWADIYVALGYFDTPAQARRSGWDGPIKEGFDTVEADEPGRVIWSLMVGDRFSDV